MMLGNFELLKKCTGKGCEEDAERILILVDPEKEQMVVCCFCAKCTAHHESLFSGGEE